MTVACWWLLAALHALPGLALVRPALIERLYGVAPGGDVFVLLQHRAALFAAVAAACLWAAFDPAARGVSCVVVSISMLTFLALYWAAGSPPALRTIALADLAGLAPLAWVTWRAWG